MPGERVFWVALVVQILLLWLQCLSGHVATHSNYLENTLVLCIVGQCCYARVSLSSSVYEAEVKVCASM